MKLQKVYEDADAALVPYEHYIAGLQLSKVTGWRIRKRGWINTMTLCGKVYVTRAEIRRFETRVANGEFASLRQPLSIAKQGGGGS